MFTNYLSVSVIDGVQCKKLDKNSMAFGNLSFEYILWFVTFLPTDYLVETTKQIFSNFFTLYWFYYYDLYIELLLFIQRNSMNFLYMKIVFYRDNLLFYVRNTGIEKIFFDH